MAVKAPANPAAREPKVKRHFEFSKLFKSGRMIGYLVIWTLMFCISVALLGLVSQQIHRHGGRERFDYPGQEYGHAMGLLLFTAVWTVLICLTHWAFGVRVYIILFLITGVFAGTGAGILQKSPFGRSINCKKPIEYFPANFQPYYSECGLVMAISGLAWAIFGLSVIGLVYSIFDHFSFSVRNTKAYDIEKEPTVVEKNLERIESGATNTRSHHTSA